MATDDERCREAERFQRVDEAFRAGDLDALRAALDDAAAIPHGPMPELIGSCLVYAIYRSPLPFIRTLLALGADPNAPVDDGFPPLIAALSAGQDAPGASPRKDVPDVLRLLVKWGADPNQRGINDYTPLHMAVATRNLRAIQILLDAGADPLLRTRIDDCATPQEMAAAGAMPDAVRLLAGPERRRLRSGLTLLVDVPGAGEPVRRQQNYRVRLSLSLNHGEPVRWTIVPGPVGVARLEDDGQTLITETRVDRRSLIPGLFYGVDGMRVGGLRRFEIAPHLAYGDSGVPGRIPANALLIAEIEILDVVRR